MGDTIALASIDQQALNEIRDLDSSAGTIVLREIVEQLAHSLKGGSSQLGAFLLASLSADMIASAAQDDPEKLESLYERAAIEHCSVLAGLDKALQNMAA